MNKIDTDYKSLDEINPEIVRFYSEDLRTRIIGYTDDDEPKPITEEYTVIVLNKPDIVPYGFVESRIARRFGRDVINSALVSAIEWEDFDVNHDQYIKWKIAYKLWEEIQPTKPVEDGEAGTPVVVPAPVRPVIDMSNRREYYEKITTDFDVNLFVKTGIENNYDDENLKNVVVNILERRPDGEISDYHSEIAIGTRFDCVYAPVMTQHGLIDVGEGKDGVFGIENVRDALSAYSVGMGGVDVVMWIMTDNSVAELTIGDLKSVIVDFNTRKQVIFMGYGQWRETDRQLPFTCE
jgi:hypothetical protein